MKTTSHKIEKSMKPSEDGKISHGSAESML
jgi:hypothetical protein